MTYHDPDIHALDGAHSVFLFDYVYYLTQPYLKSTFIPMHGF